MSTTALPTRTCPPGCTADHTEDDQRVMHYTADRAVADNTGNPVKVTTYLDETEERASVYLDGHQLTPAVARELAGLLNAAADESLLALLWVEKAVTR